MLEITGDQIANLNDTDLRTLVARLALAELRAQGCPSSSVTAGGNQDAADGGLDVRVECPSSLNTPDFVPRQHTGFQVKKPNMPASAIKGEMRPGGVLRPVIADLAARSGAYIIVSAQGSVADKPLNDRREAIRKQFADLPDASQLYSDFYDRHRLEAWVRHYPGIAAWIRTRLGIGMSGWSSIGDWYGVEVKEKTPYLFNDKACLTDERTSERRQLTICEGIVQLRAALTQPRQCIRLIGLSGLGKTRLVHALFENDVGENPLDPGLTVYTDHSEETAPTAWAMAHHLVSKRQRAILIVDNCKPATHGDLARICSEEKSQVSLLTVEYDVRDDEPERTGVFRLQSASFEIVALWLEKTFPDVTQVDRRRISEFSDGNFRVARALAETLGKGETLGKLKNCDLFDRIVQQRNAPDPGLISAAQEVALLYSINGKGTSEDDDELVLVAAIRGVAVTTIYAALDTLRQRGIVQLRGQWRAILPHAIANHLASCALARIPPSNFDHFCASLTPRMQKSLSRRLGYLHDSSEAQETVERWLRADGLLGDLTALEEDGLQIITNIAPVAPGAVLARIEQEIDGSRSAEILDPYSSNRRKWIRLIKLLAYDQSLFEQAATLLAKFLAAEPPDHNINSASDMFAELFHLQLSGTQALPDQRRAVVRQLAQSGDPALALCASVALNALLKDENFASSSYFDFGARSRDDGWHPSSCSDILAWHNGTIDLAIELSPVIEEARDHLAHSVGRLWHFDACHDSLERAAIQFSAERPWIKGWIGFRTLQLLKGSTMSNDMRARLIALIERLEPANLLNKARAIVIGCINFDICGVDGGADGVMLAKEIGTQLAHDQNTRGAFIAELLIQPYHSRAYECGIGLSDGAADLDVMWRELLGLFSTANADRGNPKLLGGFIHGAHTKDSAFADTALEDVIQNPDLAAKLPYLQAQVAVDTQGIARLRRAIEQGVLSAQDFHSIANVYFRESPPEALGPLLTDIASLSDGVEIALNILNSRFLCDLKGGRQCAPPLIVIGQDLLPRGTYFGDLQSKFDFQLDTVIHVCCAGPGGEATLRGICARIRADLADVYLSPCGVPDASFNDFANVLETLFETYSLIALDEFLLPELMPTNSKFFEGNFDLGELMENVGVESLVQWAAVDPNQRYPLLGKSIPMFKMTEGERENDVSNLFKEILVQAPDQRAFLGDIRSHLHPFILSGSLVDALEQRLVAIRKLGQDLGGDVRQWVVEMTPELSNRIQREREQSFE
ncbi:hypothetical protein [Neokomagataea anthophila]|uniref:ATP-binding protein n=1 Tax=Neokomagataea anthophila TaxID=2826925 RepID=A0ABS5E981_9PROT|nr:hypothetical protein [Neokomagataea anthophila]MBR0560467.1 hypothetical protein [Neokomagataea anthophila]